MSKWLDPQPQEEEPKPEPRPTLEMERSTKTLLQLPKTRQEVILTAALMYEKLNQLEQLFKTRREVQQRPIIEPACDEYGVEDKNGHKHLIGTIEINDVEVEVEIIREKKASRVLNRVAAEELLKSKGLYESCTKVVSSIEFDEEKILEAYEANRISSRELDSIFTESEYWATKVRTDEEQINSLRKTRLKLQKDNKNKKVSERELPQIEST